MWSTCILWWCSDLCGNLGGTFRQVVPGVEVVGKNEIKVWCLQILGVHVEGTIPRTHHLKGRNQPGTYKIKKNSVSGPNLRKELDLHHFWDCASTTAILFQTSRTSVVFCTRCPGRVLWSRRLNWTLVSTNSSNNYSNLGLSKCLILSETSSCKQIEVGAPSARYPSRNLTRQDSNT